MPAPQHTEALLIYPHQLFANHPGLELNLPIYLVEEPLFFSQYKFHKQKLIFHRASMKAFAEKLSKTHQVFYINFDQSLPKSLKKIHTTTLDDDYLQQKLAQQFELIIHPSPGFLTPLETLKNRLGDDKKKYLMQSFYQKQRRELNILMAGSKPVGGKWSFDADNRKKLPKQITIPDLPKIHSAKSQPLLKEAITYIEKNFPKNYGQTKNFFYPITHQEADRWLDEFLENRLNLFGDYEDAISQHHQFVFHSLLSPLINSGLITPQQVINKTLEFADRNQTPLNSLEGFVRQIIGWREFIRGLYHLKGRQQRTKNHWNHTRRLPKSFWTGETGLLPVDHVIKNCLQNAYSHHIERLMIMGNIMLLLEIDPDDAYLWFMEMYIDAYDWVMVPNVYGMTQYADGGLMTTKPYISSSNYIRKMSDFPKGDWCEIWDGLYWRFIHKHQEFFSKNPRLSVMTLALKRMSPEKLSGHLKISEEFIAGL